VCVRSPLIQKTWFLVGGDMAHKRIKKEAKEEKRNRFRQRGPAYWMAVGTLAAYTTYGSKAVMPAYAQQDRGAVKTTTPTGQTRGLLVARFDIVPGSLGDALTDFQNTAGIQVTFSQQTIRNLWSPSVNGLYTPEQALQKILAGTGLAYRFTVPTKVLVEVAGPSTTVEVTSNVLPDALPKYTEPLIDTPQSISVVPRHVLEAQGTTTLRDALRNVAGISLAAGEGGSQGDNLTIRGFTARNDIFLDGMRDFGSYYRDPFDMQEVDVLQGPSSVVFGRGSTGGVVNQTTKTPRTDRFVTGGFDFGTDLTRRVTADFNFPVRQLGPGAAFRLNVMGQDSNVASRDIAENRRAGIAPSLALGLGTPTRFTLGYFHQSADDTPDYGIPWLFNGPAPVRRENYYGFEHGNYLKTHVNVGTAEVEHDFTNGIRLRSQLRYAHYKRDARITEALIAGDPTIDTPLSDLDVDRNQIAVNSLETFLDNQTDLSANFRTGFVQHTFVGGIEAGPKLQRRSAAHSSMFREQVCWIQTPIRPSPASRGFRPA
jgi:catecholate siderophore receptor